MRFPLFSSVFLTLCIVGIPSASAATLYWVGEDGASMNVATNWKTTNPVACGGGDATDPPTAADTIIFDKDCDNSAVAAQSLTVTTMNLNTGYTGTVSLAAPLTVGTFTQSDGTFAMHDQSLTVTAITILGGSYDAGMGLVTLIGNSSTINVNSSLTLYDLTVSATNGHSKTVAAGDTLIIDHILTLADGRITQSTTIPSVGTVQVNGDIHLLDTFDGGGAQIRFTGANDQTFIGNARRLRELPPMQFAKTSGILTVSGTLLGNT